jgi:hypothetical protein
VTVHPRGPIETDRATRIIESAGPSEVAHRDLDNHGFERAASPTQHPWIKHLWLEWKGDAHCIYCRLFESNAH